VTLGAPQFGRQVAVSLKSQLMSPSPATPHSFLDPAGEKPDATIIESGVGIGDHGAEPCATAGENDSPRTDK
jgi:hypothetical protein